MSDDPSPFATIDDLAALLRARKISPTELTALFLQRIERHNPKLNAFITVTPEHALAQARFAERELARSHAKSRRAPSALFGIPIALKDNIWTRGIRTTAGSKILSDFVPPENATVAQKLERAGAILLGKTNMHEFAYGVTNVNVHFGAAHNPWAPGRITGGSSGGSAAAIAAGLCAASVGTDTGGSIRIPSAMCGVAGIKPTFGRVSCYGVVPLAPTFDHVGPLARSVMDLAILLGILAGRDARDSSTSAKRVEDFAGAMRAFRDKKRRKPLAGIRLGRARNYFWSKLDLEVRAVTEAAVAGLQGLGAILREISLPLLDGSVGPSTQIALAEARHYHESAGYFPARAADYSEEVRKRLELGGNVRATEYLAALDAQKKVRAEMEAAFEEVDAIVAPTVPIPAPPIGAESVHIGGEEETVRSALVRMNRPANLTGHPAISIPCGFTSAGLPVGLQLIGRAFDEMTLLRIALAYERSNDWPARHPKLD